MQCSHPQSVLIQVPGVVSPSPVGAGTRGRDRQCPVGAQHGVPEHQDAVCTSFQDSDREGGYAEPGLTPCSIPLLLVVDGAVPPSGPHQCFLPVPSESHDANLGGSAVSDHHEGKADDEGADRFAEVSFLGGAWGCCAG